MTSALDQTQFNFDIDELESQAEFTGVIVRDVMRAGQKGPYLSLLIHVPDTGSYETKNINWVDPSNRKAFANSGLKTFLTTLKTLGVKGGAPGSFTGNILNWKYEPKSFTNKDKEVISYQELMITGHEGQADLGECTALAQAFDAKVAQSTQSTGGQARQSTPAPAHAPLSRPTVPEGEDLAYVLDFLAGSNPDEVGFKATRDHWFKERPQYRQGITTGALIDLLIEQGELGVSDAGFYTRS